MPPRPVTLTFINTGKAAAVFQVRSTNAADPVRNYTVEGWQEAQRYVDCCLVL